MFFAKRDPVCKAKISKTEYKLKYGKKTYFFDCSACLATFKQEPERFVGKKSGKGLLKWLTRDTQDVPKSCHQVKT